MAEPRDWNASNQWGTAVEVIYAFDWILNKPDRTLTSKDGKIVFNVKLSSSDMIHYNIQIASLVTDSVKNINLDGYVGDEDKNTSSITDINAKAFENKQLDTLTLPTSINSIESDAFTGGTVKALHLKGDCPTISPEGPIAMKDNHLCVVYVPDDKLSNYHVEDAVKNSYTNWGNLPYIIGESGKLAKTAFSYVTKDMTIDDLNFPAFMPPLVSVGQLFQFEMKAVNPSYTLGVEGFKDDETTALTTVSYKDSIVSIKLAEAPTTDLKLKVMLIKPITTNGDEIYVKDDKYKVGASGTYDPYNAQIGDGKTALNVSKLIFETPSTPDKAISVAIKQVTVAPATGTAISTSVEENTKVKLTLFGKNSFGALENKGTLTLNVGDNTAQIDVANTQITNDCNFADYTGQIRTVSGDMPLTIQASSSKQNETVTSNGTVTLKADVTVAENTTVEYKWERLVGENWVAVELAANKLKSDTLPNTLVVAATNIGDYRCLITATGTNTSTLLCNYTTVTVSDPATDNYYTVTLPKVEGAITTPLAGDYYVIERDSFSFALSLDKGYNQSKPVVKVNDIELKLGKNGKYKILSVIADTKIVITGVVKNAPVGINGADKADAKVWSENGTLYVHTPTPQRVTIYTVAGALYKDLGTVSGDTQVMMQKGLYVVVIGNKSIKIAMK